MGIRRSYAAVSKEVGLPVQKVQALANHHNWQTRALAYDHAQQQLIVNVDNISLENTLAHQHAVGMLLLDYGIQAVQAKNPKLIKMGDAIKLLQAGADMSRKGAGYTDTLKVSVDGESIQGVQALINELIDLPAEDVDEISEDE